MANLKEIRTRISSVSSTRQITSAMKMVSAAKLRKAQDAIIKMRPYANKLHDILTDLTATLEDSVENIYGEDREVMKVLIVPISANRGLCGAFNSNVVKKAIEVTLEMYPEQHNQKNVYFWSIGKKASDALIYRGYNVIKTNNGLFDSISFESVSVIAQELMQKYEDGTYDRIIFVYNRFLNAASQQLVAEQFLPVKIETKTPHVVKTDYIFEPDKETILNQLIPKSLKIQLYKAILDSNASEQGARMTAMHKATDNANELIKELKLYYNKARQGAITSEILEIVSGAEALK